MFIQKTYRRDMRDALHTAHADIDRRDRLGEVFNRLDSAELVDCFAVDKGHLNGLEIHSVYSTGDLLVHNARTDLLVTGYRARRGQVYRLYEACQIPVPAVFREMYK